MTGQADRLREEAVFGGASAGSVVGAEGEVQQRVTSTMDVARQRLAEGAPDGYVVLAEEQSHGRGRKGQWHCVAGRGILLSVVLRRGLAPAERRLIGLMGVVAAVEAVRSFGVGAHVKWPNDLVAEAPEGATGRLLKLGGVMAEAVSRRDVAPAHALGIGLNVNQAPEELPEETAMPPASMRSLTGRRFDRAQVCRRLLRQLNRWYRYLSMGRPEHILARWRSRSCLLDRFVRARVGGRLVAGRVIGIRSTGELILRNSRGDKLLLSPERTHLLLDPA